MVSVIFIASKVCKFICWDEFVLQRLDFSVAYFFECMSLVYDYFLLLIDFEWRSFSGKLSMCVSVVGDGD